MKELVSMGDEGVEAAKDGEQSGKGRDEREEDGEDEETGVSVRRVGNRVGGGEGFEFGAEVIGGGNGRERVADRVEESKDREIAQASKSSAVARSDDEAAGNVYEVEREGCEGLKKGTRTSRRE